MSARSGAAVLVLWLAACSPPPAPPSLLVITIDTLRADAVSAWNAASAGAVGAAAPAAASGPAARTPCLDALAASGSRFTNATSVTPLTLPAHASLFTGLRPARHGLTVNGVALPRLPVPTLAEQLQAHGYRTAAFVSAAVLDGAHGLAAGFEHYDDALRLPGGPALPHERRGDHTVERALDWLRGAEQPWFAWVHLYDPHAPYEAPGGPRGNERPAYLAEVAFADTQVGRLLAGLPSGPVLVVVTADHGEGLGEHGEQTHGLLLHQATMHVPLAVAWHGLPDEAPRGSLPFDTPGVERRDVVSLLDVVPTVLDVLGRRVPADLDGVSLVDEAPERPLPLESRSPAYYYGFSPLAGVRQGAAKLVGAPQARTPGWWLYDLQQDPHETGGQPADEHPLRGRVPSTTPATEAAQVIDGSTLQALGYVAGAPPEAASADRTDPRLAMDLVDALDSANSLLVEGQPALAWALLLPLGGEHDEVAELHYLRGRALRALARPREAVEALDRASTLQAGSAAILVEAGRARLDLAAVHDLPPAEREAVLADAVSCFSRALERVPGESQAVAGWALADLAAGRPEAALARLDVSLAEAPDAVNLLLVRQRALLALGRRADALALQERLQALAPDLLPATDTGAGALR